MEINAEMIRFLVETCRRNDMPASEAHKFICKAWGDEATTIQTVYRLYRNFASNVRTSFEDNKREGRPRSTSREEMGAAVRELLAEDPHVSINDLVEYTQASHGMIQRILSEDLNLRCVTARWVPHDLTPEQKDNRVRESRNILQFFSRHRRVITDRLIVVDEKWIFHRTVGTKSSNKVWASEDSIKPTVVRRLQHERKSMIIVAFSFDGHFCVDVLPHGQNVNSDYYLQFLRQVIHNYGRHVHPLLPNDMVLMNDNARPHTTRAVSDFLQQKGITPLKQPPYSPDYNILDRWVFSLLEKNRIHRSFDSEDNVKSYVTEQLRSLQNDDISYQFQKLKDDLQLIIDAEGNYL